MLIQDSHFFRVRAMYPNEGPTNMLDRQQAKLLAYNWSMM